MSTPNPQAPATQPGAGKTLAADRDHIFAVALFHAISGDESMLRRLYQEESAARLAEEAAPAAEPAEGERLAAIKALSLGEPSPVGFVMTDEERWLLGLVRRLTAALAAKEAPSQPAPAEMSLEEQDAEIERAFSEVRRKSLKVTQLEVVQPAPAAGEGERRNSISEEQMVRDLLEQAIKDGLVAKTTPDEYDDPDPGSRTSGELVGVANMLAGFLKTRTPQEGDPLPPLTPEQRRLIYAALHHHLVDCAGSGADPDDLMYEIDRTFAAARPAAQGREEQKA